ncbi:Uncharacterized protein TPAR_01530 [Tolypocladium paradoxum]|uniref:Uncharacterized protein n=1 Tax=Tolypocladium paradoxum TaxID=94208 RepID=A0A2S4L748_9HYPO|nr:Uncharacterized protein TPAR_01530 [Tolypocladium paradoxum]
MWDYGDLRVTLTSNYSWNWDDTGNGISQHTIIWTPVAQGGMRSLGSVCLGQGFFELGNQRASLLVGNNPSSTSSRPAVASPVGWTWCWNPKGQGGKHDGTICRPIAPDGYVALGDVAQYLWDQPSLSTIWCLRADLVQDATFEGNNIWNDQGSGGDWDVSCWSVVPRPVGTSGSEKLPIFADTFRYNGAYARPDLSLAAGP